MESLKLLVFQVQKHLLIIIQDRGAFMDKLQVHRAIGVGGTLPVFERLEYDTTYTIQEVETIQSMMKEHKMEYII